MIFCVVDCWSASSRLWGSLTEFENCETKQLGVVQEEIIFFLFFLYKMAEIEVQIQFPEN